MMPRSVLLPPDSRIDTDTFHLKWPTTIGNRQPVRDQGKYVPDMLSRPAQWHAHDKGLRIHLGKQGIE